MNIIEKNDFEYECPECDVGYHSVVEFKKHIRNYHMGPEYQSPSATEDPSQSSSTTKCIRLKKDRCPSCNKRFTHAYLPIHIKLQRCLQYWCKWCNQNFGSNYTLTLHRSIVHTSEKPFQCMFCKERFKTKQFLLVHTKNCN